MFEIHLRLKKQEPREFDLAALAEATEGFSGAEIEQIVVAALYGALHQKRGLDRDRLLNEAGATIPLSVARAEDVARLRKAPKGRFVDVSC